MNKQGRIHSLVIWALITIVVAITLLLLFNGYSYYSSNIDQRHFSSVHNQLKPSGFIGHGLGIVGASFIVIGVFSYMARKRIRHFSRIGLLKYWLEFHIFLCVLGPVLILFHTAFKFGGIIAIGFWSMLAVVASGVVGRFIYLQIPRTIEGRMLSLHEVEELIEKVKAELKGNYRVDPSLTKLIDEILEKQYSQKVRNWLSNFIEERKYLRQLKQEMKPYNLRSIEFQEIKQLCADAIVLNRRIRRLNTMHRHFRNWHVVHLPIALVMLVIMLIHIGVALFFGYKWIL